MLEHSGTKRQKQKQNRTLMALTLSTIIDKWNLMKLKVFSYDKGHYHLSKAAVYKMESDFYKLYI